MEQLERDKQNAPCRTTGSQDDDRQLTENQAQDLQATDGQLTVSPVSQEAQQKAIQTLGLLAGDQNAFQSLIDDLGEEGARLTAMNMLTDTALQLPMLAIRNRVYRSAWTDWFQQTRRRLAGANPSQHKRELAERVTVAAFYLRLLEMEQAKALGDPTGVKHATLLALERVLERAQRRLLGAMHALLALRRLEPPEIIIEPKKRRARIEAATDENET